MNKFFTFVLIISFIACNTKKDNMDLVQYDTEKFEAFEKNALIKKEEAWNLQAAYYKNKGEHVFGKLFFVSGKDYVFSVTYYPKMLEAEMSGVYVHSDTGEVRFVEDRRKVKTVSQFGWSGKKR